MKGSRDLWFLIVVLAIGGMIVYFTASRQNLKTDSPSSHSTGKNGLKAAYLGLESLGFTVSRQTGQLWMPPKDARVMISGEPQMAIPEWYIVPLARWVRRGNTLILADSRTLSQIAMEFGFAPDLSNRPPILPKSVAPVRGDYSSGVRSVQTYPTSFIGADSDAEPVVRLDQGIVISSRRFGRGRVIFVSDPGMFANSGIGTEDNFVLFSNLVYENAGKGDRVLFLEWDKIMADEIENESPLLARSGALALGELLVVVLVLLVSASRRFGTAHPLPETVERRKGAEFVVAMAGLYRRAQAREAALTSVYESFRRELVVKFGVSPEAGPVEAADTVLRARQIDREKLIALLERCDGAAHGREKLADGDVVALTRTIEEFRRELGIARSTDD